MRQYIHIGRALVDDSPGAVFDGTVVPWTVLQQSVSVPLASQLRVAVDEYCVAVYGRHEYEEKTIRYDDGHGIIWYAGRCKNCGTLFYVPRSVEEEQKIVLPRSTLVQLS